MKKICPTDSHHNRFVARVLVAQDWLVDRDGKLIDLMEEDIHIAPIFDPTGHWHCLECGTPAVNEPQKAY